MGNKAPALYINMIVGGARANLLRLFPVLVAALLALAAEGQEDDLPPSKTATAPQTEPQPAPANPLNFYSLLAPEDLAAELQKRHLEGGTFAEMIERVTRGLVAAPYLLSPLGEGEGFDPDPRFRLDAFDCTTFVETAIALSECDSVEGAAEALDRVRYEADSKSFVARNHLMSAQWVPHLIELGLLEDVTEEIGGDKTKRIDLEMSRARWKKRRVAKTLVLPIEAVPVGSFRVNYLPLADVLAMRDRVPPGTIMNIIRPDVPSSPDVVTHQGLIVTLPGSEVRVVRHASPVSKRVIDETLEHMMERYLRSKDSRKWPIIGASFYRLVDPRAASKAVAGAP